MMKAAFSAWDNRIAPVFDVAQQIHLVEAESGQVVSEISEPLAGAFPVQKALRLAELGVGTLICGAISRNLHEMIRANGIRVIPFVAGDLHEVIQAWLTGGLDRNAFTMPGCGRRGQLRRMGGISREGEFMNKGSRMGRGGGQGQGRGGRRAGRMGGRISGGPGGNCICPQCGQTQPHKRGVPCVDHKCPQCGSAMTRE